MVDRWHRIRSTARASTRLAVAVTVMVVSVSCASGDARPDSEAAPSVSEPGPVPTEPTPGPVSTEPTSGTSVLPSSTAPRPTNTESSTSTPTTDASPEPSTPSSTTTTSTTTTSPATTSPATTSQTLVPAAVAGCVELYELSAPVLVDGLLVLDERLGGLAMSEVSAFDAAELDAVFAEMELVTGFQAFATAREDLECADVEFTISPQVCAGLQAAAEETTLAPEMIDDWVTLLPCAQ